MRLEMHKSVLPNCSPLRRNDAYGASARSGCLLLVAGLFFVRRDAARLHRAAAGEGGIPPPAIVSGPGGGSQQVFPAAGEGGENVRGERPA